MPKKKTAAAGRVKATAEGLQLPLNTPVVVPTPIKPRAALKNAARKTARDTKPRLSQEPGKSVGGGDLMAEGQVMIATLESCGVLAAKGAESLGKEVASLARGSVQAHFALTEALINAKTLQEALTIQGNFARESLGNVTEGFTRLVGMSMDLTQAVMAPIQARVRTNLT